MAWHAETCALVTGGAQGLGRAVAHELVSEGCTNIVIADRAEALGAEVAAELGARGANASFLQIDLGAAESAAAMVETAAQRMGRVTALVNCAASTERGSILDTAPDDFDAIMAINTRAPFFALQRFAQLAIEGGFAASAVNILSIVVHGGLPFLAPYGASKAALLYVTKNAANTLARHRIRVNGINVGWMDTPGEDARQKASHGRKDGWQAEAEASMPFGALVKPEEVARQAAFFLGPQSGVVTGAILDFDQQVVGAYPDTDAH